MGNYYLLRDGLITDTSTYGTSISGAEKINSADAYTLTTSDSWSTKLSGSAGDVIDSIAVHLSSRAATPTGTLDGSVKQFAGPVTKINITQNTDSPFGIGTDSSVSFNGTTSYITTPASTNINLGAGDFTIELWIKSSTYTSSNSISRRIFCFGDSNDASANNLQLMFNSANLGKVTLRTAAGDRITSTNSITDNNWHHICIVRSSGVIRLYIDGTVQTATYTSATNYNAGSTLPMYIGRYSATQGFYQGSISNFRIVVGSSITPPLPAAWLPLTSVTNTKFLYKSPYQDLYENENSTTFSVGTWPVSSFTSYDGSDNSIATHPLNWQLLKLSPTFTNNTEYFKLNLKTSNPDQLTLMGESVIDGIDYDRMVIKDQYIGTSTTNVHIGGIIDGFNTQTRTITANTGSYNNIYVHKDGLLKFSDTSTTLTISGGDGLQATSEGIIQVGSSTTPVPNNTTHEIILSGNHIGVSNGGRLDVYGAYKVPHTKFTQNYDALVNNFNTAEDITSWKINDTVVLLPNTTSSNTTEIFTINSFLNSNNFVINTGTSNFPHSVLSYVPNAANLTRNVKIGGVSFTKKGNIQARGGAFVNVNNAEFKYIDGSLSTGVDSNGVFSVSGCTLSGNGTETLLTSIDTEFATVFNGTNSYIQGPANNTGFDVNVGTPFTLECFIKTDTVTPSFNPFFSVRPVTISNNDIGAFRLALRTSTVAFWDGGTELVSPVNSIKINKWYHLAVVGNGNTVRLYINGKLQGSKAQVSWKFLSTYVMILGKYENIVAAANYFKGKISNLRFVKGQAVYTENFTTPTGILSEITGTGITTAILTLQNGNNTPVDNSSNNATLTLANITTDLDSPFGKKNLNSSVNNNVLFKTQYGIYLYNILSENTTITNNLILSSKDTGIYIDDGLKGDITLGNNISVGPSPYGSYIENNTTGTKLNGIVNYNNTYGMAVNGSHSGQIDNVINTYNTRDGLIIDGTITQLNETVFSNITASNNRTLGVRLTGNPIDHLAPVILNINRLVANDNLSGGFEGYCIAGNLSSLELNRNGFYGMKTSIGNYNTTFDGITALMNNVASTSAAIGILSGICYYPILIKDANVGKSVSSSTFGAGISLDSTKFSEFSVDNSTVSGGSSDFQLKTTKNILEGSYLISNTNVGVLPVGVGISTTNYQSDVLKTTGFAFTNMNNITGYHVTYLAAGNRSIDSTTTCNINETTSPSERLTPQSTSLKLRSGSKFVALSSGESTAIAVYVRKSTLATNGVAYNGTAPRLILKRNGAVGINSDILMDQLDTTSENFLKLVGVTPEVTDAGVLEFYVDCDGTQGWINIDNWTAN